MATSLVAVSFSQPCSQLRAEKLTNPAGTPISPAWGYSCDYNREIVYITAKSHKAKPILESQKATNTIKKPPKNGYRCFTLRECHRNGCLHHCAGQRYRPPYVLLELRHCWRRDRPPRR